MNELQILQDYLQQAKEQYRCYKEVAREVIKILLRELNHSLDYYDAQCYDDENGFYADTLENVIFAFMEDQTFENYTIDDLMKDIKNAFRQDSYESQEEFEKY